jgi:tRNA(fMet)-specific endonuclease VapC
VGTLIDSSLFIAVERAAMREPGRRDSNLADVVAALAVENEEVGMASITASELLHGVNRAAPQARARRAAFVEATLIAFPPIAFDLAAARIHAELWAGLVMRRSPIGPHDLIVAATALAIGWSVATLNHREFSRVPGLDVVVPALSAG